MRREVMRTKQGWLIKQGSGAPDPFLDWFIWTLIAGTFVAQVFFIGMFFYSLWAGW